jgi:hypothetical protein
LDFALAIAKRVQTLLGDVHDCDVWQDQLDEFASEEHDRLCTLYGHGKLFAKLDRGLQYLREDRRRRRELAFAELLELWRETKEHGLWEDLADAIHTRRNEHPTTDTKPVEMAEDEPESSMPAQPAATSASNGNGEREDAAVEPSTNHSPHFKPPKQGHRRHRRKKAMATQ